MVTIDSTTAASRRNRRGHPCKSVCLIFVLLVVIIIAISLLNGNDNDYYESQIMKLSDALNNNAPKIANDYVHNEDGGAVVSSGDDDDKSQSSSLQRKTKSESAVAATIGYAVSITGCDGKEENVKDNLFIDGAAVLKHSVHRNSIHGSGKYDYQMYAIYHPNAESCTLPLGDLGYTLLKRETPINVSDIKGDFLRERIEGNGCCGEKELIKLYAYTLVEHPIVVHIDLDVLVLKPFDPLFDAMLLEDDISATPEQLQQARSKLDVMWIDLPLPKKINAFFTRDLSLVWPELEPKPIQGGFIVVRPNMDIYHEFVSIVLEGDFRKGGGWGGKTSQYWGCMTIQGILPFFYDILHPNNSTTPSGGVELNRCIWNNMCDNPRTNPTINDKVSGKCRTGEADGCEDCRERGLEEIYSTHFTVCQKPWLCHYPGSGLKYDLCTKLHREWFNVRHELETSWGRSGWGTGKHRKDFFYGNCDGHDKYHRIQEPYLWFNKNRSIASN